ncbi:MAG: DUF1957 domain-containing protein [Spirochaetes bacterium]|nr:MAG: DUF1957 domain-containing protein [Spirochaetota bacterium]
MGSGKGARARLAFVLHAHIPWVRIPEERFPLQELWLYQAMLDSYIPFLQMVEHLWPAGIPPKITLSVSPTLISMLDDPYFTARFLDYLAVLKELCGIAAKRGGFDAARAAGFLARRAAESGDWLARQERGLVGAIRAAAGHGVNLICTAATHAFLPAWRHSPGMVRLQVETGLRCFEKIIGSRPDGFWLPEMGYYAGLDGLLAHARIDYTFLSAHSLYATPTVPPTGNFFPVVTGTGLRVFPRDAGLSDRIWSRESGYPGDVRYREFHRDYTYDIPEGELSSHGVTRSPFGLRLFGITGGSSEKKFYDPGEASLACDEHAEGFIAAVRERAARVRELAGIDPVFTLPFDLELFGHWWYEGPLFLERVLRAVEQSDDLELVTPDDFPGGLDMPLVVPAESSWGRGGYGATWLNPDVIDVYSRAAGLFDRLCALSRRADPHSIFAAAREIMLLQSSDWAFGISNDNFRDYFLGRIAEHTGAAETIIGRMESGADDNDFTAGRAARYPIFDTLAGEIAELVRKG